MLSRNIACIAVLISICWDVCGQEIQNLAEKVPSILMLRAEEDYRFLRNNDSVDLFLKAVKYIPLGKQNASSLTLGGGYRTRIEHSTNKDFTTEDETFFSQRLDFHASLDLCSRVRLFAELYHGFSSIGAVPLQSDELDIHQAFIDWHLLTTDNADAKLRLGRQETGYGASRLVGIREGPNLRRSFDMARLVIRQKKASLDIFYGKEVFIRPGAFDNQSSIFINDGDNPAFWGMYYRRPFLKGAGKIDLYYFGFYARTSAFNDVLGDELRHSFGIRSFGTKGRLTYNTELIIQVGEIAENKIFALNLETDWKFRLIDNRWKLNLGLKLDWSSGDRHVGDGKVGTFNPMFVNPAIYSLAAINTPANLTSLHPNISINPAKGISIYIEYAIFYRTQLADGFYSPPRFIYRSATNNQSRHLGNVWGLQLNYEINRNLSFDLLMSYFIAGAFIKETGESENIIFTAPTLSFKF